MTTTRRACRTFSFPGCILVLLLAGSLTLSPTAHASALRPHKIVDEERCFSEPVPPEDVPDDVEEHFALGSPVYGDEALWSIAANRSWFEQGGTGNPPGPAIAGLKLGWYRRERGRVEVTVTMLPSSMEQADAVIAAGPLEGAARVPEGYGLHGFQVSGIEFPAAGCWMITGELVSTEATRAVISTMYFLIWVPPPTPTP